MKSIKNELEERMGNLREQFEMLANLEGEDVSQLDLGLNIPKEQNEFWVKVAADFNRAFAPLRAGEQAIKEQLSQEVAPEPSDE